MSEKKYNVYINFAATKKVEVYADSPEEAELEAEEQFFKEDAINYTALNVETVEASDKDD